MQDWYLITVRFNLAVISMIVLVLNLYEALKTFQIGIWSSNVSLHLYIFQVKKKAKWIRKAMKEFRDYEEKVVDFKAKHPEFNPPSVKSFLTQEEQKILDK